MRLSVSIAKNVVCPLLLPCCCCCLVCSLLPCRGLSPVAKNRNGLVVDTETTLGTGTAERDAALVMAKR